MTEHPCKGMTKAQVAMFERIAIGDDRMISPRAPTIAALLARGVVERTEERLSGPLPITIYRYHVPLNVHAQWCEWCDENVKDEP